jgi:hypothetical protein
MPSTLWDALRERLTAKNAAGWAVVVAILWHFADGATGQFAITVSSMAVAALGAILTDVYDVDSSVTHLSFGAYVLVSATGLLLFGDGTVWLSLALLAAGGWVVFDVVQTFRHESALADDPRDGREVYRDYVARRVHETLDERPRTRRELFDALDADDEDVEAAVDRLVDRGVVERTGSEYRVTDDESGGTFELGGAIRSALARIARPVTLELRDDEADAGNGLQEPSGRTDAPSGSGGGRVDSDSREADSRDRELDAESGR